MSRSIVAKPPSPASASIRARSALSSKRQVPSRAIRASSPSRGGQPDLLLLAPLFARPRALEQPDEEREEDGADLRLEPDAAGLDA